MCLSLSHTPTPSLLLCEKPQPHKEPQICPVNYAQTETHKETQNATMTRPSLPFPRRQKTQTSQPVFHF